MTLADLLSMPRVIAVNVYQSEPPGFHEMPPGARVRAIDCAFGREYDSTVVPPASLTELSCGQMPHLIAAPMKVRRN